MKLLVGSIGSLGFLVKKIVREGEPNRWTIMRDEPALSLHLRQVRVSDAQIRETLRRVRSDGRAVLSIAEPERAGTS